MTKQEIEQLQDVLRDAKGVIADAHKVAKDDRLKDRLLRAAKNLMIMDVKAAAWKATIGRK